MLSLKEKDRAGYCPPRIWKVGEVALLKLPNKDKGFWPLVRILEFFPDNGQVVCTVKILKPDLSEIIVNPQMAGVPYMEQNHLHGQWWKFRIWNDIQKTKENDVKTILFSLVYLTPIKLPLYMSTGERGERKREKD